MAVSWAQIRVSTHSRPKAAGYSWHQYQDAFLCFNTQPPEGGWKKPLNILVMSVCFNTQPPEGGWYNMHGAGSGWVGVSTHSRPKAAGTEAMANGASAVVSTHSRPKAAGPVADAACRACSFQHTAARRRLEGQPVQARRCCRFNTQPPEGGWVTL